MNQGENVIEFTPENTGEVMFSCLMGMYTGKFIIIDGNNLKSEGDVSDNNTKSTSDSDSSIAANTTTTTSKDDQKETTSTTEENKTAADTTAASNGDSQLQVIKTTYISSNKDISPNQFTVKVNKPVRFIIDVNETGQGCMSTIMISGLVNEPVFLEKGKTIIFGFTPTLKGSYSITCAMGVPRGILVVE